MKQSPFQALPAATGPAMLAAASFLLLWPFARLDFDRYHDGYMLAQAIAVHGGASIQGDVFAQYGPVTPWIQSIALFLPIGPGLALRTINVVFIAVTVLLLADMGRNSPRGWPITRAVGWWAAITWLVLADVWIGIPMLPWSSTLCAMFSVATLYLLMRSMRYAQDGRSRAASAAAVFGGVFLGLMPFTRITVGVSAVAVCLVLAVLILFRGAGAQKRLATIFMLGILVSAVIVVAALAGTGSVGDFYQQSIRWPLTWRQNATENLRTQAFLGSIIIFQAVPVTLVCVVLYLQSRVRTAPRGWTVSTSGANAFTLLVGVIVVLWENLRIFFASPGGSPLKATSNPLPELFSPSNQYIYFFMVLVVVLSLLMGAARLFRYVFAERSAGDLIAWLLLGGLALSGLTQIIPTFDPKHVWWGAPIGILVLFSTVGETSQLKRLSGNPLILPLVATTVMAAVSAFGYAGLARVPGQAGTLADGMFISKEKSRQIDQDTKFLGEELHGSRSAVYLVRDGDLSILDGRYRSADAYFVNWGDVPQVERRILKGAPIVVQTSTFGARQIQALAHSIKYHVSANNPRLAVLRPLNRPLQ
jgi:hypothetical protein